LGVATRAPNFREKKRKKSFSIIEGGGGGFEEGQPDESFIFKKEKRCEKKGEIGGRTGRGVDPPGGA